VKSCVIRQATVQDEAAVLGILREAFAPFRHFYSDEGFFDTTLTSKSYKKRLAHSTILLAEFNGKPAGTVACSRLCEEEGHLRGMAVLPEYQGLGIAQRLLEAAEAQIRAWGCKRVTLDTTNPLQRAIHFYEKNGYQATGRVTDFFGLSLYDYVKSLK
jgi:GNAT superfamily N-acetyltransferase